MADTTTTAPLSDEAAPAVELLIAAVYACASRLDRDELTNEAGEPLRIIGAALEDALGIDVKLNEGFLYERGLKYAEGGELGLAHAVDSYLMPTTLIRERLDDVDIPAILAKHDAVIRLSPGVLECLDESCDYRLPAATATPGMLRAHQVDKIRAALLGEATQ